MSRNNQDRLGPTVQSADAPPAQQAASTNSQPLQFVVPTEFVELPTAGSSMPRTILSTTSQRLKLNL